ncbi:phosphate ABC transporter substrate-binding protein PstS [Granulicella sp. 5B5]|uniref:phosphate ABC transporter substrate-binding protein PstS n=1 Tax=Granulicella sp. 5B5 TaxID=1617967 RepID=UPI0021032725|nr:phosphate ABC transporter substrate-binding protein PstS [Granulicella sp. 5B5]
MKTNILSAFLLSACVATAGVSVASAQHLTGAGASFPNPIYSKWFSEYSASHPGVQINYQSVGSGAGIRQVSEKTVDFGASDGPMTDAQLAASKVKLYHIPTVLGAVVPVYNVPGVKAPLKFAPEVIADIYLGKITKWNDPRLTKDNPGVSLPDHTILPVYRSDGSGTTYIFTDFLSKVSPDFASKIGKNTSVRWPLGIGQKGNEGVASMVRSSEYAFGYVELIYAKANNMQYGYVRNAAGKWLLASTEGVTAAAAGAAKNMPADYRVSITNAPGADAYPISSFTWLLIPVKSDDPAKGKVLKDFLTWMLDKGEAEASSMTYAPLPASVVKMERKTIATIQ